MITRFSASGQRLAQGDETGRLTVFDVAQDAFLWSQPAAHQGAILALAWSLDQPSAANEPLLASGGQDGRICLWQAKSGTLLQVLPAGEPVEQLAWSAHGTLASTSGEHVRLWERVPDPARSQRRGGAPRVRRQDCPHLPQNRSGLLRQRRHGRQRPSSAPGRSASFHRESLSPSGFGDLPRHA